MNEWSTSATPFVFILDYALKEPLLYRLDDVPSHISIQIDNWRCNSLPDLKDTVPILQSFPQPYQQYKNQFDNVKKAILRGESYLLNLSCKTPILSTSTLQEIFQYSDARCKVLIQDKFVCFSPEKFIEIKEGIISTFPMKGTIDAQQKNAHIELTNNPKEIAEHATVVDLLRNDLSKVARQVHVSDFAYLDRIETTHGDSLLQMSSKVSGVLKNNKLEVGTILSALLPAGSITGAPKKRTCELIADIEDYERGYYTGVCGYFDGKNLDSGVMIRFIEKQGDQLYFKSGGGITHQSKSINEYNEIINKIYVPISGKCADRQRESTLAGSTQ